MIIDAETENSEPGSNPLVCEDITSLDHFFRNTKLTVWSLNIRSVQANWDQFLCYLEQMTARPKVIVLSEIWYTPNCDYGTHYRPPGYNVFVSTTTINKACGVLILIAEELNVTEREEWTIVGASVMSIKFQLDSEECTIIGMYRSHAASVAEFVIDFKNKFRSSNEGITIFTGDINLNILETEATHEIAEYYDFLHELGFLSWINVPTRQNSCLDHIMVKAPRDMFRHSKSAILNVHLTDHLPVAFAIDSPSATIGADNPDHVIRKIDYNKLHEVMILVDWTPVYMQNDVNQAFDIFLNIVQNCIELCSITKKPRNHKLRKLKPWITAALVNSINHRDDLAKKAKKYPRNNNLRASYAQYRNKLKDIISKAKNDYFAEQVLRAGKNSAKLWKTINYALGKTGNDKILINKLLHNGEEISEPKRIASKLNEYFISVGRELNSKFPEYSPYRDLPNSVNTVMSLRSTTEEEVHKTIMSIRGGTGPGWDGITSDIIKNLGVYLTSPLTHAINLSILNGEFPDALKIAVVRPLFKKGAKTAACNYRPISLLSNFAKIYEKIVKAQLVNYLEANNIFSTAQFGFRNKLSTQDALAEAVTEISDSIHDSKKVIGIFIDLTKAFDSIEIKRLLLKLGKLGLDSTALRWFTSYLTNRRQHVKYQCVESTMGTVEYGVPQGSVLGPLLFLLHVNDLFSLDVDCKFVAFADDVAIIVKGESWEQTHTQATGVMDRIAKWFELNSLTVNISKTKYITFSINKTGQPTESEITLHQNNCSASNRDCNCQKIEKVESIRYLGLTLDQHLKWQEHIQGLVSRIRRTFHLFVLTRNWLSRRNIQMVYYAFVYSILIYGIPVWGGAYATTFSTLEVAINTALRIATKSQRRTPTANLYKDLDVLSPRMTHVYRLAIYVHKNIDKFERRNITRTTRTNVNYVLLMTRPNNDFYTRQLPWLGPAIFEHLPLQIKTTSSMIAYKKQLYNYLTNATNVQEMTVKFKL